MVRKLQIGFYVFLFWIMLPAALIFSSKLLDRQLDMYLHPSLILMALAGTIIILSSVMLSVSISQFIRFGSELPISAFHTKRLIRSGLYSIWRHPIYLFYTLLFIGVGIVLQSGAMVSIVLPLLVLVESLYVFLEESSLVSRYGEEYKAYRKNTSLLVPNLQSIIRFPCLWFFKFKFNLRIINRERIPCQLPFFILAAHRNYFDPFFIGVTTLLPLYYITTFEVFRSPLSRLIFQKLYCIPRKRYLTDTQATREIATKIHERCVIMIFPEGERS